MVRKIVKKFTEGEKQNALAVMPVFVLPDNSTRLVTSILLFLFVALLIYFLERVWIKHFVFKTKETEELQRILIWEFGTILSIIGVFFLKQYCVVLPLLFLLIFLIMWYLIRVVSK